MRTASQPGRPGRPPTITRERLADAGIALGLPRVTMVGVAAWLNVSQVALYKHVPGLDALKQLIAEAIFLRWQLPVLPSTPDRRVLPRYLRAFSDSMWELVVRHPGIAPYLLREDMVTPAMLERMAAHQHALAGGFALEVAQARWLLFTLSYHCVAVADTTLPLGTAEPAADAQARMHRYRACYDLGADALIRGALGMLPELDLAAFAG